MNSNKILFIATFYDLGEEERTQISWIKALIKEGYTIEIFLLQNAINVKSLQFFSKEELTKINDITESITSNMNEVGMISGSSNPNPFYYNKMKESFNKKINSKDFDKVIIFAKNVEHIIYSYKLPKHKCIVYLNSNYTTFVNNTIKEKKKISNTIIKKLKAVIVVNDRKDISKLNKKIELKEDKKIITIGRFIIEEDIENHRNEEIWYNHLNNEIFTNEYINISCFDVLSSELTSYEEIFEIEKRLKEENIGSVVNIINNTANKSIHLVDFKRFTNTETDKLMYFLDKYPNINYLGRRENNIPYIDKSDIVISFQKDKDTTQNTEIIANYLETIFINFNQNDFDIEKLIELIRTQKLKNQNTKELFIKSSESYENFISLMKRSI